MKRQLADIKMTNYANNYKIYNFNSDKKSNLENLKNLLPGSVRNVAFSNIVLSSFVPNLYQLNFLRQTYPFDRNIELYRSYSSKADLQFYAFYNGKLYKYHYDNKSEFFQGEWNSTLVTDEASESNVLYFPERLENDQSILMLKTPQGINIYKYRNMSLDLLVKSDHFDENEFSDVYDWNKPGNIIKSGHFYHDQSVVGILTKHQKYGIKFYAVMKDELLAGEYPIWPLDTDLSILGNYSQADFFLSDLQGKGQENIIVRNWEGLNIYEFNQGNGLVHLMQVPNGAKLDNSEQKLFFSDLTGQSYKDIVALNSSGLFIYQYSIGQNNYGFIHYNPLFSKIKGWNSEHISSVQFEDIDLDGRRDMFFTGPRGIDILTFDNYTNHWRSLLDNSQFTISERHSEIKAIYANPSVGEHPIVFTQHKNQLHWASTVEIKKSIEEEVWVQIANETLYRPTPSIVPQLLQLQSEEEKSTLLLRDQLDCLSIFDAVDKNTGKPKFKLPLIDLSNLSSNIKLDFFYDGNSKASDILGLGWSLPQNCIMMDHQSSIFPEDEKYYVILHDVPQRLIFDSSNSTDTVYCFKLSTDQPDLRIHYHKNEERWEIDSSGTRQIYGRTGSARSDSINWELAWENWRSVGSSSTGQKKLATGWYLAEVRDKNDNLVRYTYEIVNVSVPNGKSFTREICLKTIVDNQGNEVIFNYSDKEESEYNLLPLIDKEGNLNTRKVQTRYVSGYKVSTPGYQQDINFGYRLVDGKRLLTEIRQREDITNQSILQFTYKEFLASNMLEQVTLPTGASVEFSYQSIGKSSHITRELGQRCDVQKSHRIDYGNYDVLISYINKQGQVVLRMFNQEMTEELYSSVSSSISSRFPLLGRGLVKAHEIVHAEDFFAVILYYNTDKELCLFHTEGDKWLQIPKYYSFNEDTMIRFGTDFMVVANANSSVEIIDWNKASKQWTKIQFFNRDNVSVLLAASGRMFLIYDDQGLLVGYRNHVNEWQSKVIKEIPGVASRIQKTLEKFNLSNNVHKHLLSYLNNNALQLNNNLLLLSTWEAKGPQLYSIINLFVLDRTYQIVQEQQYRIDQDDINVFSREVEDSSNNKYTLAYGLNGDKYKFTVKDFSGPINDELENGKKVALDEIEENKCKALSQIEAARVDLKIKAEEARTDLQNRAYEAKRDFQDNATQVRASLDARVKTEKDVVSSRMKKVKTDLENKVKGVHDDIHSSVQNARADMWVKVEKVKTEAFSEITKQGRKFLAEVQSKEERDEIHRLMQKEKDSVLSKLREEVSKVNAQLAKESNEAYRKLDEKVNETYKQLNKSTSEVYQKFEESKNEVYEQLERRLREDFDQLEEKINEAYERLEEQVSQAYQQLEDGEKEVYKNVMDNRIRVYEQLEDIKAKICKNVASLWEKEFFLLDPVKYTATLNSQIALCSDRKFTFTGDKWKEETISETDLRLENFSIPLGKKLVLHKENSQSSLKLYSQGNNGEKQGSSLLDLGVKQLNQTLQMYPVYLAYQEKDKQVGIVEYSRDGTIDKTYKLPQEEKLSLWSSYQTLVTHIKNLGSEDNKTLVFRQQFGVRHLLPNAIITNTAVTLENGSKRITGYEYDVSSAKVLGNFVYYEKTSIIPGNNKNSFGWIEEVKDFDNYSNVERKVFNAQGVLIRTLKLQEEMASTNDTIVDTENLYLNTTLLDKTGKLEVAQFFPYKIADEEASHYGFENYEINKIGKNVSLPEKRWVFNEADVVRQGFSFTGQSYLSLSRSILEGTFQPNNQNQEYVASCWMRLQSRVFGLGAVTPYLRAVVSAENGDEIFGLLSEVKFQSGDWFYLEVVIDLLHAQQIYKGLQKSLNSTLIEQPDINLKTSIIVSPGTNNTIDVDHVRFSPLNSNSKVNVYDPKNKQVKEVIHANGLVEKYVYDEYQKEIASINEYGQLEKLSSYTKASSISRVVQLKSSIQIQPETGFYEDFSPYSFKERWKIDNADAWKISLGQLRHFTNLLHSLQLNPYDINSASHGMRMCFSLQSENSFIKFNDHLKLMRTGNRANIIVSGKRLSVALNGEMLVAVEHGRLLVWIDGGLYFDGSSNGYLFNLGVSGKVIISDVVIFSEPSIQVTYFNALDEKLQEVVLEGENTAIVTEYLYDQLGRQTITTQPARIERSNSQSVLAYYPNFVTNSNLYSANSVWKTGQLQGNVSKIIGEHSYSQTKYDNNPLDERCAVGLPGREFSVSGSYAKRFTSSSKNLFINNLFPSGQNYSYQVEYKPGGVEDISVFDKKNNRVALYTHVPGSRDLLSTYEYDENDELVKSLPPLYHEVVRTFHKLNLQLQSLPAEEKALQDFLGTHTSYDGRGNVIVKTTPDSGKIEYLYDNNGLPNFCVHYSQLNGEEVENVIYFDYDQFGKLISTGKLTSPLPKKDDLLNLAISSNNTEEYQQFYHSDFEREPILRGKIKRTITFNNGEPLIEESIFNVGQETLSKRILIPVIGSDEPVLIALNKRYAAGKLREIEYPIDVQGNSFKLTYSYNKLGKVIGIGVPGKKNLFVNFVHNSAGQVISEQHLPEAVKNFTRQYSYNAPGFLTKLEDKFLAEKVYYTNGSYGGHGYGDGTVTRTEFKATWHELCDNRKFGLNERSFVSENITPEESKFYFHKLKETGYLNERNLQTKAYYPALEPKLPIVYSYGIVGRQIAKTLGEKGFPTEYGHSYDYGNHQELTKAKYFVGNEVPLPLQPDSFAKEIQGINSTVSHDIWQTLRSAGYLNEDNAKVDISLSHAKRGKSFIRPTLFSDLRRVNANYGGYKIPLERLLATAFSKRQNLSLIKSNFQDAFIKWNTGDGSNELKQTASKIIEMLERKQYLDDPLNEEFRNLLGKYESFIPDIVRLLSEHFARQLGEAEFDVESYDIDANGNHKHYYAGFDRYELSYRNNTNQVNSVKFKSYSLSNPEQNFAIKHNSRGNIIQALHKGIEQIDYDAVSNRATKMRLTDGKALLFYYDAQGERILKRVTNSKGQTTKEIQYIRDEFGRALVERQITYISQDLPPDILITAYIYGPRGLLGFIRRDEFYSLITDHEGSIRLVVKGDEVVAAYDYLPYGGFIREYGSNPEAHISYRYTGQELDEETALYNYHARFYDPSIGRFYQIDPKGQYFSPYKYAGNTPVSMIDPDGELAWFILVPLMIGLGTGGAYLGGAASNKNWNPGQWKWDSGRTWLGIVGGGIGGALLPVGFGASVSAFTAIGLSSSAAIGAATGLGIGGVYFSTAASNNEWDPSKWDFSSPETWNAAFQGFSIGSGAAGGIHSAGSFYKGLSSTWGKGAFIFGSTGMGGGIFVLNGFAADWDFSKPGVYFGFVDAITGAPDLPMFLRGANRFLSKNFRNVVSSFKSLNGQRGRYLGGTVFSNMNQAIQGVDASEALKRLASKQTWGNTATFLGDLSKSVGKSVGNIAGGVAVAGFSAYLMGSAVGENGWDLTSAYTYHAMINGMLTGGQLASSGRAYYKSRKVKGSISENQVEVRQLRNQLYTPERFDLEFKIIQAKKLQSKIDLEVVAKDYAKEGLILYNREIKNGKVIGDVGIDIEGAARKVLTTYGKRTSDGSQRMAIVEEIVGIYKEQFQKSKTGLGIGTKEVLGIYIDRMGMQSSRNHKVNLDFAKEVIKTCKEKFVIPQEESISRLHPSRTGQDSIGHSKAVEKNLENSDIPNSDISVMYNDHVAVVTYSTDRSPGLVMYVDRRKGTSYYIPLTDNKRIGGIEVSKHQSILDSIKKIDAKKEELRTMNIKERFKDQVERELVSVLGKHHVEANEIKVVSETLMESLKKTFDNNKKSSNGIGYLSEKDIKKINVFSLLSQEIKKLLGTKNKELKTLTSETDQLQKTTEINALKEKVSKLDELKIDSRANSEVTERLWRNGGLDDLEQFPSWLPSNCAEPNAIVALLSSPKRFSLDMENYGPNDIVMATYKVPKNILPDEVIQNLEPHERCRNCKITTKEIDKVITDPVWLERIGKWKEDLAKLNLPKLNEKSSEFDLLNDKLQAKSSDLNQLKEELFKLDHLKQRSFFLTPNYYRANRFAIINATDNRNSSLSIRQKRSLGRKVMVEVEHSAIGRNMNGTERWREPIAVRNKKITNSSSARIGSKINNLFSWVKSSIDGLFSSKLESNASSVSQVDMQFLSVSNNGSSNRSFDTEETTKHKLKCRKDIPNSTTTTTSSSSPGVKQKGKHAHKYFTNGDFFQYNTADYVNANQKQMHEQQSSVNFKPSGGNTILEMGDYYLSQVDFNGAITLLDMLIKKLTPGEKHVSTQVKDISAQEALHYAFTITQECEKIVEQTALKSGISMHLLNIDFVGMQKEVTKTIISRKFDAISGVLSSYVEKAYTGREAVKLNPKRFEKFMAKFNNKLDASLNQSIHQMLHNT